MKDAVFLMVTDEESKLPFILKSIGSRPNQEHIDRPDGYPDFHWLHCSSGTGRLIVGNREYLIHPDTGFFFFPGVPHEYYALTEPWETYWITFSGHAAMDTVKLLKYKHYGVYTNLDTAYLCSLLGEIYSKALVFSPFRSFVCSHLVYRFIVELKNCIEASASGHRNYPARLQPVISFIESNHNKALSLEDMAEVIDVTTRHLCRLFRQFLNITPFDYLTGYRIKKAKEILISASNPTIKQVAGMTGYHSASYFCSVFKEKEGITPLEFKRIHKSG